jgi:LacI family transcriptional regulator
VAVDDWRGGELAVAHLLALGHRRIAVVNGPLAIRQCADRRRGAYHAVIRAGLDPAAVLTEISVLAMNTLCGTEAADKIRAPGPYGPGVPTAAFCTNDLLALGLLRRLSQLGAQVPGDLAIVGYDDIDFAADSAVPLTSIRQPKYELGQTAAQLILEEADAPAEHEHRRFVFTPELITRASSQPEPARPAPES